MNIYILYSNNVNYYNYIDTLLNSVIIIFVVMCFKLGCIRKSYYPKASILWRPCWPKSVYAKIKKKTNCAKSPSSSGKRHMAHVCALWCSDVIRYIIKHRCRRGPVRGEDDIRDLTWLKFIGRWRSVRHDTKTYLSRRRCRARVNVLISI